MNLKDKLLNGVELSAKEVEDLVIDSGWLPAEHFNDIHYTEVTIKGEDRRWSRTNVDIFGADDRFFGVYWEEGLTENQENTFTAQVAVEYERKQVLTYKWTKKEK